VSELDDVKAERDRWESLARGANARAGHLFAKLRKAVTPEAFAAIEAELEAERREHAITTRGHLNASEAMFLRGEEVAKLREALDRAQRESQGLYEECARLREEHRADLGRREERVHALEAQVEALTKERDEAREDAEGCTCTFGLPPLDEDGCCATCGADCNHRLAAYQEGYAAARAESERLRLEVERLAAKWDEIAATHVGLANEWRRVSTPDDPHGIAVATREAMADVYRATATDLRSLLSPPPDATPEERGCGCHHRLGQVCAKHRPSGASGDATPAKEES
jgi:hypothetical protein